MFLLLFKLVCNAFLHGQENSLSCNLKSHLIVQFCTSMLRKVMTCGLPNRPNSCVFDTYVICLLQVAWDGADGVMWLRKLSD